MTARRVEDEAGRGVPAPSSVKVPVCSPLLRGVITTELVVELAELPGPLAAVLFRAGAWYCCRSLVLLVSPKTPGEPETFGARCRVKMLSAVVLRGSTTVFQLPPFSVRKFVPRVPAENGLERKLCDLAVDLLKLEFRYPFCLRPVVKGARAVEDLGVF